MRLVRLWFFALAVVLWLPQAAAATWSVILTDSNTREIAIGSATCVTGIDLKQLASVVVVTKGAAAAQSAVDVTGQNRMLIFEELQAGTDPALILLKLSEQDPSHQSRQYGIVDTLERAAGFTGSSAGGFAGDLTGQIGTITYAIQGNLLTGEPVLTAAEAAILGQGRDLASKLMLAMLAAREKGGDGRCSCSPSNPEGCGAPPPEFEKSAHVGYMVVARLGDVDGSCNAAAGCASGDYYMDLNVAFQGSNDEDPVVQLQQEFAVWRQQLVGHPDHHRSSMSLLDPVLPADGTSVTRARIVARDLQGTRLVEGGATVTVTIDPASTATAGIGDVMDRGEGVYAVELTAGTTPGEVLFDVVIDDGEVAAQLSPLPLLELVAVD